MRSLLVLLCLVPVACGGGVSADPSDNPAAGGGAGGNIGVGGESGSGTGGSGGSVAPTAKSLLCSAASIQHEDDIAIWYQSPTEVAFLRHDGTQTIVHQAATDQKSMGASVGAAGNHIGLIATQSELASDAYLFDRQANMIGHEVFSEQIFDLFVGEQAMAFSVGGSEFTDATGRVWDGVNPPRNLGHWLPINAPEADGWVGVHSPWDGDLPENNVYGFLGPKGEFQQFSKGQQSVFSVKGHLITIDKTTRTLLIGSHTETKQIALAEFSAGDTDAPYIREQRKEGWISIQRNMLEANVPSVLVVNVVTGESHEVPADPGPGNALAFWCNAGFPGFLASDGTLLRSRITDGKLEMLRGDQPFGMPLSGIAALYLHERNGTVVQVGSDGSDTYCGDNSGWPVVQNTLYGDSVQIYRNGETSVGDFVASYESPVLDSSGSCALLNEYAGGEMYPLRVKDLETKTTRDFEMGDWYQWAQWIE